MTEIPLLRRDSRTKTKMASNSAGCSERSKKKNGRDGRRAKPLENAAARRHPSLIGTIKARRRVRVVGVMKYESKLVKRNGRADAISRFRRRFEVETRYESPSFTVDAASSSSFSLGRSTGLSANVKRIYREVGQLPSHGTSFLTLPSSRNLKVNSRPQSCSRGGGGGWRGHGARSRQSSPSKRRDFDEKLRL